MNRFGFDMDWIKYKILYDFLKEYGVDMVTVVLENDHNDVGCEIFMIFFCNVINNGNFRKKILVKKTQYNMHLKIRLSNNNENKW